MTNFFKVILFAFLGVFAISCNKTSDIAEAAPPRPYAEQAPIDDAKIQEFFAKYHLETSAYDPLDDSSSYNVTFVEADDTNPAKWSIKKQYLGATPLMITKIVSVGGVEHKLYYLPFVNPDNDTNGGSNPPTTSGKGDKPTVVDSIKVCYRVRLLDNKTVDNRERVPVWFSLRSVYVQAWREIFPLFGAGKDPVTDSFSGVTLYKKYGAGIMFLPSALGYYNLFQNGIDAYSPLIFNFKLVEVNYTDDDYDGVDSKFEDLNGNGIYSDDDTDGDGRSNYLDQDDDGDGRTTKDEIRISGVLPSSYSLIKDCSGNTTGLKKHLDKSCQ